MGICSGGTGEEARSLRRASGSALPYSPRQDKGPTRGYKPRRWAAFSLPISSQRAKKLRLSKSCVTQGELLPSLAPCGLS